MRYGFFDGPNREYVIERPDTPRAWSNYLGSRKYGGIITAGAEERRLNPRSSSAKLRWAVKVRKPLEKNAK